MITVQYKKMLAAKKAYLDTLRTEADPLHDYYSTDATSNFLLSRCGEETYSPSFPLGFAKLHKDRFLHDNIYLPITDQEVRRFITHTENNDDLDYLPNK